MPSINYDLFTKENLKYIFSKQGLKDAFFWVIDALCHGGQIAFEHIKNASWQRLVMYVTVFVVFIYNIGNITDAVGDVIAYSILEVSISVLSKLSGQTKEDARLFIKWMIKACRDRPLTYIIEFLKGVGFAYDLIVATEEKANGTAPTRDVDIDEFYKNLTIELNKTNSTAIGSIAPHVSTPKFGVVNLTAMKEVYSLWLWNATQNPEIVRDFWKLTNPNEELQYMKKHIPTLTPLFNDLRERIKIVPVLDGANSGNTGNATRELPKKPEGTTSGVDHGIFVMKTLNSASKTINTFAEIASETDEFTFNGAIAVTLLFATTGFAMWRRWRNGNARIDQMLKIHQNRVVIDDINTFNAYLREFGCRSSQELITKFSQRGGILVITPEVVKDFSSEVEHAQKDKDEKARKSKSTPVAREPVYFNGVKVDLDHEKKYSSYVQSQRAFYRGKGEQIPERYAEHD